MREFFKIRREERLLLPLALLLMIALNAMMLGYNYELFTRGGHLGFYGLFTGHFELSGYDNLTYVTLSNWKLYYTLFRHPLITPLMYPFAMLNCWQMQYTEVNIAIHIVAAVLVVCGVCSFLLFHRIMRDVAGLGRADSLLLTMFFFSFAHVMVASFAPDHFGVSMCLLLIALYLAGRHLRRGTSMGRWSTAVLFTLTAGVTLTNGVKTLLASLFSCGWRRFFDWRRLAVTVLLPVAILSGAYLWQHYALELPDKRINDARTEKLMKTDKKFVAKMKRRDEWRKTHAGEKLIDSPYFEWTDKSTSRLHAAVENLFGESVQLHQQYLLRDTNRTRPNYVAYDWWLNYFVEAVVVFLFVAGVWSGRHDRFVQLCLSWFAFDMILHLVLGFAVLEVYIMTAHWIFIIPIAAASLLRAVSLRLRPWLRGLLVVLTLYLWIYNGCLVASYLMHL